jgi:hypothetical protein
MDYPENRPALGIPGQGPNGSPPAAFPQPEGFFSPDPSGATQHGFTAGSMWDREAKYDLSNYVKGNAATGTIPHPTQERIDAFMEAGAFFEVEAMRLQHEAAMQQRQLNAERQKKIKEAAKKGEVYIEPFDVEEAKKEAKEALSELHRLHDQMRDHLAEFCKGHPTRAALGKLPDPEFRRFNNWVGSLINPEV